MNSALWRTIPSELLAVEVLRRLARTREGAAKMRLTCRAWRAAANELWVPPAGWHAAQVDAMARGRYLVHGGNHDRDDLELPRRLDFVLGRPGLTRAAATHDPEYRGYGNVTYCLAADGNLRQFRRLGEMFGQDLWVGEEDRIVALALEHGHLELLRWVCETYTLSPYYDEDLMEGLGESLLRDGATLAQCLLEHIGSDRLGDLLNVCIEEDHDVYADLVRKGDIATLKWLRAAHPDVWDEPAPPAGPYAWMLERSLAAACSAQNVEIVGWLLAAGVGAAIEAGRVDPGEALRCALEAESHDALKSLCGWPSIKTHVLEAAFRHWAVPALRWLVVHYGFTPDALHAALTR